MFITDRNELDQLEVGHPVEIARREFALEDLSPPQQVRGQVPLRTVRRKLLQGYFAEPF